MGPVLEGPGIESRRRGPLVIAHRGSSAEAPENTVAAFRLARRDGADGVELDVMRCASGELVVFHDDELDRLCGVPGALREQSLSALRELSVRGEPIPTLDEVFDELGEAMLVNVELKSAPDLRGQLIDDGLASEVAALLRRRGLRERVIVSSFDPLLLARFRWIAPEVSTALLFGDEQVLPLRRAWAASLLRVAAMHPSSTLVDERSMARWRRRGLGVNVWTVDEPAEIRYLVGLGVDALITNKPRETRAIVSAQRSSAAS